MDHALHDLLPLTKRLQRCGRDRIPTESIQLKVDVRMLYVFEPRQIADPRPTRVAYVDSGKSEAHVVEVATLGAASNMVTACRQTVVTFGRFLPPMRQSWTAQDAPWCTACMATLG